MSTLTKTARSSYSVTDEHFVSEAIKCSERVFTYRWKGTSDEEAVWFLSNSA